MSSDIPDKQLRSGEIPQHESIELNSRDHAKPADVPVFNCTVYVSAETGGGVRARVANLSGLECTAANERAALGKIVPAFKRRVGELMQSKSPIPWIEPPSPAEPGEQNRFVPVHL